MEDPSTWVYKADGDYDSKRHEQERVSQGFSEYDWWGFNSYLDWVIIGGLKKFKDGHGFPVYGGVETMDDWRAVLDKMISGFEAHYKLMNHEWEGNAERLEFQRLWEDGRELFVKFYDSLWD